MRPTRSASSRAERKLRACSRGTPARIAAAIPRAMRLRRRRSAIVRHEVLPVRVGIEREEIRDVAVGERRVASRRGEASCATTNHRASRGRPTASPLRADHHACRSDRLPRRESYRSVTAEHGSARLRWSDTYPCRSSERSPPRIRLAHRRLRPSDALRPRGGHRNSRPIRGESPDRRCLAASRPGDDRGCGIRSERSWTYEPPQSYEERVLSRRGNEVNTSRKSSLALGRMLAYQKSEHRAAFSIVIGQRTAYIARREQRDRERRRCKRATRGAAPHERRPTRHS